MFLENIWPAWTVSRMKLSRTFVSGLLLGALALASCSSSSDSASQPAKPTTTEPANTENSPATTVAASSLVVRPALQVAKMEDPDATTSSVATAPGTAILTGRDGNVYLVGSFDTQDGIFSKDAMAYPEVVDGVTNWSVFLSVLNDAAWSEISKACSALSSSCPTGRVAVIAEGKVISAPDFSGYDYGLTGSVELSGFADEAEAQRAAKLAND